MDTGVTTSTLAACAMIAVACGGRTADGSVGGSAGASTTGSASSTGGRAGAGIGSGGAGPVEIPDASGTGGGPEVDVLCLPQRMQLPPVPVDLFLLVDRSDSMNCSAVDSTCQQPSMPLPPETRWSGTYTALKSLVDAPGLAMRGIGVGLGFFPMLGMSECDSNAYAQPTVPIAPLLGNEGALVAALAMNTPSGGKPTMAALGGALAYAKSYVSKMPAREAAVVLISDGGPDGCDGSPADAALVATAGYGGTPSIRTYVIGLGNGVVLEPIALAGSGQSMHVFSAATNPAMEILGALNQIASVVTCDYGYPLGVDPLLANIDIQLGGGLPMHVGKVDGAANCGSLGGWFFDQLPIPNKVTLCPQTCDPVKANPGEAGVTLLTGCW